MKLSLFQNLYFSESVSAIHQAAETRSVFLCVDTSSWHDSGYQISGNNNTYLLRETRSRAENNHIYKYVVLSCIYVLSLCSLPRDYWHSCWLEINVV